MYLIFHFLQRKHIMYEHMKCYVNIKKKTVSELSLPRTNSDIAMWYHAAVCAKVLQGNEHRKGVREEVLNRDASVLKSIWRSELWPNKGSDRSAGSVTSPLPALLGNYDRSTDPTTTNQLRTLGINYVIVHFQLWKL